MYVTFKNLRNLEVAITIASGFSSCFSYLARQKPLRQMCEAPLEYGKTPVTIRIRKLDRQEI